MKTSELKKWLENNDISYTETENEIDVGVSCIGCLWHASPFGQPVAGRVQTLVPLS